jgi:hypothetical protein
MCCWTALMFPSKAASPIEMSGTLAVGGFGFAASTTGSTSFASAGVADCCASPHPTRSTAATIETSSDFIARELSPRLGWVARGIICC